jgi:L-rhamnose mutarotase
MRVALHSVIVDGAVDDYRTAHARVPDELAALFERAGIREWSIWRSGDRLFHLVDCDDWEHAMQVVKGDPADERWQADIGRFVAGFHGPHGEDAYAPLENVWSLSDQVAP